MYSKKCLESNIGSCITQIKFGCSYVKIVVMLICSCFVEKGPNLSPIYGPTCRLLLKAW